MYLDPGLDIISHLDTFSEEFGTYLAETQWDSARAQHWGCFCLNRTMRTPLTVRSIWLLSSTSAVPSLAYTVTSKQTKGSRIGHEISKQIDVFSTIQCAVGLLRQCCCSARDIKKTAILRIAGCYLFRWFNMYFKELKKISMHSYKWTWTWWWPADLKECKLM